MDAVILAAGKGERLRDLTPAFHKPLLPIDGVPLVSRAVDLAHVAGVDRPVVVVAPSNADIISRVLGKRDVALVIQREPRGPGDALLTGLMHRTRPTLSDRVLVLLADNVSTDADVAAVAEEKTAIGVKKISWQDAQRFTRWEDGHWIEKIPLGPGHHSRLCWVGPFVGWRENMETALIHAQPSENDELLIGPLLSAFMLGDIGPIVEVSSYDVGTLATYPKNGVTGG